MKVLLLEKIKKLGNIGDLVDVKDGYARNYLFTRKKALRFTKENEERFEAEKEIIEKFRGGPVLLKCLQNRLEYGSRYSDQVEKQIND